jgi:hypothetical protein
LIITNNIPNYVYSIGPSAIPNAKKYNELGVKNELSKDDLSRTDGYIQTAVC